MKFKVLIPKKEILSKIKKVAKELNKEYKNKEIVLVMIMKSSLRFVSDLIPHLKDPLIVEYIGCISFKKNSLERKKLVISNLKNLNLKDKHVLLVDDIFDSGVTLSAVADQIIKKNPASLKTLVLLYKKSKKETAFLPDKFLFEVEDNFVLGYGLDYKENYRGLKHIYTAEKK